MSYFQLPIDVIHEVLAGTPDFATLSAAIQISKTHHGVFQAHPKSIVRAVAENVVGSAMGLHPAARLAEYQHQCSLRDEDLIVRRGDITGLPDESHFATLDYTTSPKLMPRVEQNAWSVGILRDFYSQRYDYPFPSSRLSVLPAQHPLTHHNAVLGGRIAHRSTAYWLPKRLCGLTGRYIAIGCGSKWYRRMLSGRRGTPATTTTTTTIKKLWPNYATSLLPSSKPYLRKSCWRYSTLPHSSERRAYGERRGVSPMSSCPLKNVLSCLLFPADRLTSSHTSSVGPGLLAKSLADINVADHYSYVSWDPIQEFIKDVLLSRNVKTDQLHDKIASAIVATAVGTGDKCMLVEDTKNDPC